MRYFLQKPHKPRFDEAAEIEAALAACIATMKPRHISEILSRDIFNTVITDSTEPTPVVASLLAIEDGRKNFARYMSTVFNLHIGPDHSTSWMRGISFLSGFCLNQASMILKHMRPDPDPMGLSKTVFGYSSEQKLQVLCIEMLKMMLAFYQASRYTHAIQTSNGSDNDPYPELFVCQNDAILTEFYQALEQEIPEFLAAKEPKTSGN
jgi:hypothetical protein